MSKPQYNKYATLLDVHLNLWNMDKGNPEAPKEFGGAMY